MNYFSRIPRSLLLLAGVFIFSITALTPQAAQTRELSAQDQEHTIYGKISNLHLPSLARLDSAEAEAAKELKEKNAQAVKDKKIREIKVPELGQVEKIRLMYRAFAGQESIANTLVKNTTNPNVHEDLEMYCGSAQSLDHHVFGHIDHTKTTAGKIELQKMLYNPSGNIQDIKKTQAIVDTLLKEPKTFEAFEAATEQLKKTENEWIWFHRQIEEEIGLFFDQIYFNKFLMFDLSKWNKNPEILELSALKTTLFNPIFAASWPLSIPLIQFLIARELTRVFGRDLAFGDFAEQYWAGIRQIPTDIRHFYESNALMTVKFFTTAFGALALYGYLAPIIASVKNARFYNDMSNQIQTKMINIATYSNTVQNLGKTIAAHPTLKALFPDTQAMINLTNGKSDEAIRLAKLLESGTFKGQASFFSNKGKVLATFKMMQDAKNNFIKAMQVAGQVDAYLSIAKLYKKYENHPNAKFCFVNAVEDTKPCLDIQNFWHPILNPDKVVTNSLTLGGNGPLDIIITGPNAGGKSTALKSITLAIIMAQAFGIAPAASMTFTPFAKINTYLNIADAEGKESLFQAEMRRAQALLNSIRSLGKNEFSFVIMDEIFTGTNPKEGEAAAYGVAKNLATFKNSICVVATHFKKLTELEVATNGVYNNYKVAVIKRPDGSFHCPYKLEAGISNQNIALQLLQNEGFDASIMNDAYAVLNGTEQQDSNLVAAAA